MPKLSIVVPAYNEEAHIESVVASLLSVQDQIVRETGLEAVEIVVVDDGSTDSTGPRLEIMSGKTNGRLRVVTHEVNRGYGAALKTGFDTATGDFLSFMDADGTISPTSFIGMYQTLVEQKADMVVGKRFGAHGTGMPAVRQLGNRFFALLLSFLSGERVQDTASGIRLFHRNVVSLLLPLPDGLHFTPAMSTKAIHEKLKIVEIPIPYADRSGESKLRVVSDGIRFLRIIVGTVLMYNPFKVFLLVGLMFEIGAAALFSVPLYTLASGENIHFSDYIYRSIGGLYFFTAGVQIILFGILARFIVSTFFRRHETGRLIHKLNRTLKVYERMHWYGLFVFLIGIAINALYLSRYVFFSGRIDLHWAWLLVAAGFIIVGLQMLITGVVMKILQDIKEARRLS